ncbi:hypothetical protein ACH5RR_017557 [Cinchona calisaya]|uniref:histidine kinase n=1 Tax=Cinchona calisaya TaxID=153742 RepID=A0ABD2ZNU6_9GENT
MSGFGLQRRIERQRGATMTLMELLRERIDTNTDRTIRRKSLSERLGLKGLGCCGPTWGLGPNNVNVRDDDDEDAQGGGVLELENEVINVSQAPPENGSTAVCSDGNPATSGMNLAEALEAERNFRVTQELDEMGQMAGLSSSPIRPNGSGTPFRMSLMRLLEETDGCDHGEWEKEGTRVGSDSVCCVCMGRKKGAAFIPYTNLDANQLDYAQTAHASGKDLIALINEVLDQAKIESGRLELEAVPFDLRADLDKVPEVVIGDPGRFRQIITNLVGNSIKVG